MTAIRLPALVLAATATATVPALAQDGDTQSQTDEHYTIGLITYADSVSADTLKAELAQLGYVEGENVTYEFRDGGRNKDAMPELAQEIVGTDPDVIVSMMTNAHVPVREATAENQIPVVFWSAAPQETEIIDSFREPGGNFTGFTYEPNWALLMVRLYKILYPDIQCIGHLYNHTYAPADPMRAQLERAGELMNVEITIHEPESSDDFAQEISAIADEGCPGFIVGPHELFSQNPEMIVDLAREDDLAVVSVVSSIFNADGLAAFTPPFEKGWPAMAHVVDRILKGEEPQDIPVERGLKSVFHLNLQTANALGLDVPPYLIDEVDDLVE